MRHALDINPLYQKRIYFIDCVSGFAFPEEDNIDDCMYHKPPHTLGELKDIIKFGIEKCNPDIIVLDSLSQFLNFSRPTVDELDDLYEFLGAIRQSAFNIVQNTFVLLYDNKMGVMNSLPKTSTDLILNLEIMK
jgi:hypothetical protein